MNCSQIVMTPKICTPVIDNDFLMSQAVANKHTSHIECIAPSSKSLALLGIPGVRWFI